jgi:hypothetical protein
VLLVLDAAAAAAAAHQIYRRTFKYVWSCQCKVKHVEYLLIAPKLYRLFEDGQ